MNRLLPGITAERVPTSRLTMAGLSVTGRTGPAVLFVHGNGSVTTSDGSCAAGSGDNPTRCRA
jgi:hypothetical protein